MQLTDGACRVFNILDDRRGGASISARDILGIPAVRTLPCLSTTLHTPRSDIHAKHIVHATNGTGSSDGWLGIPLFVLYSGSSEDEWDYLTQQPPDPATLDEKPRAEFI